MKNTPHLRNRVDGKPGHHYGPNVDGYEYDKWGTYHRADINGIV